MSTQSWMTLRLVRWSGFFDTLEFVEDVFESVERYERCR